MDSSAHSRLERHEFKYLLPAQLVPSVRETARLNCRPDPHAGPSGSYAIRSLYFDTWDYRLYLAKGSSWELLETVGADVTGFTDTGLLPETRYLYRVCAVTPVGETEWSNIADATTEPPGGSCAVVLGPRRSSSRATGALAGLMGFALLLIRQRRRERGQ